MVREFKVRRDMLIMGLNRLGIRCTLPDGAFYAFADVSKYGKLGRRLQNCFLTKQFVATTPGSAFGEAGNDFIRISYATSQDRIREALRRMEAVL